MDENKKEETNKRLLNWVKPELVFSEVIDTEGKNTFAATEGNVYTGPS